MNPNHYEAMQLMGDDYYNRDEYESALSWYDSAYAGGLRNRYLCHLLGYICQTQGNTTRAIELYKEALHYDSTIADIYERLLPLVPDEEKPWYQRKIASLQAEE